MQGIFNNNSFVLGQRVGANFNLTAHRGEREYIVTALKSLKIHFNLID
jgi:hypothetical protein